MVRQRERTISRSKGNPIIVEVTGLTGVGKTTLIAAVKKELADQGLTALDSYEVTLAQYRLNSVQNPKLRSLLVHLVSFLPFLRYVSTRTGMALVILAFRVIRRDAGGILVKLNLSRNLAKRIGVHMQLTRLRSQLHDCEFVICDEGTLHIAHNLFVRAELPPDPLEIEQFGNLVPKSDSIIWIRAPKEQSLKSILRRGHARVDDSRESAQSFVDHGHSTFNILCSQEAVQGKLFEIDNTFGRVTEKSSSIQDRAKAIAEFLIDLKASEETEPVAQGLRIVIISSTPFVPPWSEGVRNLIRKTANDFERRGAEVTVIGPNLPMAMQRVDSDERVINVPVVAKPPEWLRPIYQGRAWLSSALAVRKLEPQPDVLLLFASLTSALGLRTLLYRFICRKPLAILVTGLGRPRIGYSLGQSADRIFVGSEFLQRWFPSAEVILPFLPINFYPSDAKPANPDGVFKVLFLGSFEPERGVEYLLRAMRIARKKLGGGIKLILAWNGSGASNYDNIQRLIDNLEIRSIVDSRGHVDTNQIYREADIVVIPRASQERMASPVRIVEALNMRTPVVVSRICGMEKLMEGCGLAVEPRDEDALAEAILKLARDSSLRMQLEANCSKVAKQFDSRIALDSLFDDLRAIRVG